MDLFWQRTLYPSTTTLGLLACRAVRVYMGKVGIKTEVTPKNEEQRLFETSGATTYLQAQGTPSTTYNITGRIAILAAP